jgi:DNA-binding MurR/RpiR family transcriptional regulator
LVSPLPENDILAQVFATDAGNVKHTMELIAPEVFEPAVAEISRITAVLVVGGGISAPSGLFSHLSHSSMPSSLLSPPAGHAQVLAALRGLGAAYREGEVSSRE